MANTDTTTDIVLAKVRKLLAQAESTTYPEEAHAFFEKAQEMISSHSLSEALLNFEDHSRDEAGYEVLFIEMPYYQAKLMLFSAIAGLNDCKIVRGTRPQKTFSLTGRDADAYWGDFVPRKSEITGRLYKDIKFEDKALLVWLFGFRSDIQIVKELWTSLTLQATGELIAAKPAPGENAKAFRNDFLYGFAGIIRQRLAQAKERARAAAKAKERQDLHEAAVGAPSLALALLDKDKRVSQARQERFAKLSATAGGSRGNSRTGHSQGAAAGSRATLGGTGISGSRRALGR